jgi:LPS-assembly lipoprotein
MAPPGRDGYYYHRVLERSLGAARDEPAYTLTTTLTFRRRETVITIQEDVTRYDVIGTARYALTPRGAAEPSLDDVAEAVSAYTTLAAPYATAVAERDARRRVAEELARKVYGAVAATLSAKAGKGAA